MPADCPLVIRVGVDPENLPAALTAIDAEVRGLALHGPTPDEFTDAVESLVGGIPRLLETNETIAEFLQATEQFGLGIDHDRQLPGLLRAVTRADVVEAARDILDPDRASIAIAGPHDPDDTTV
jgi:predicted Zn-dependent peptidase